MRKKIKINLIGIIEQSNTMIKPQPIATPYKRVVAADGCVLDFANHSEFEEYLESRERVHA